MARKVFEMSLPVSDFEKLTVSNTAKAVTAAKINEGVFITVETDAIRWRADGTDPDATTGHLVAANGSFYIADPRSVANLRMIRVTGDATIQVTHY